jgi:starch synthase
MNILFASSEAHPLIKTGGLADVSGSLPRAIHKLRQDIRLVLPAYRPVLKQGIRVELAAHLDLPGVDAPVRILSGRLPGCKVPLYLVDSPGHFDREGNPYVMEDGNPWPDNAERFAVFCRAVHALAVDAAGLDWRADLVHCNDWQTGLVPPLLAETPQAPASLFTIHNLAYQGQFDRDTFDALGFPPHWWSMEALEFHHQFSFIKGGLVFADWLTTVSPSYAGEIRTPAFGYGLEGLLNHRAGTLTGILNGVDYTTWSPGTDPHIPVPYTRRNVADKAGNKRALLARMGLPARESAPLFAIISRLVAQKGIDLVLEILPMLLQRNAQLVVLGSGDRHLEAALRKAHAQHPDVVGLHIGYDESLSHQIEAGADIFLMPSRFEPCGLNQIYSLRYGTVPVVRRTGGLADTVIDTTAATLADRTATGFCFDAATGPALWDAVERAIHYYHEPANWQQLIETGMRQDFSWRRSAEQYLDLYERVLARRGA